MRTYKIKKKGISTRKRRVMKGGSQDLIAAVKKGNLEKVQQLVQAGANVNYKGRQGMTPLITAVTKGDYGIILYLLERGADINQADNYGVTPLLHAAMVNNNAFFIPHAYMNFELLFNNGADIHSISKDGDTALIYAIQSRNIEMIDLILDNTNTNTNNININNKNKEYINRLPKKNLTALMWACRNNDDQLIDKLFEKGADPNIRGKNGETALFIAAEHGFNEPVNKLLYYGANPNIVNKDGETALFTLPFISCRYKRKSK